MLAVSAVGMWAWTPDRSRIELDRKYGGPFTRYVEVGGTSLRVRDTGPKDAPVLVLIHGFGSSLETWTPWAQSLSTTYRVVRFDLPGCGLSEPDRTGNYGDARSVALTSELMDSMRIAKATLVGNSMGGRIAWRFAAAFPDRTRKLVLISPDGFASPGFQYGRAPQVPEFMQLMKYFLPRTLMRMNLETAYADPERLSDSVVDRYYDLLLAPGNRGASIERMRQSVLEDPVPLLRQIRARTLLLWGKKDRLIPHANAAEFLASLPNATLVTFPDLGHVPQEEAPAESLAPLETFLARYLMGRRFRAGTRRVEG
jgi:pimeloyl-ACP methyl ester carboxylesterase